MVIEWKRKARKIGANKKCSGRKLNNIRRPKKLKEN